MCIRKCRASKVVYVIAEPDGYAPDAEEAVLGSVIINPSLISDISHLLSADDFSAKNRLVWDVILYLHEHDELVHILTICNELETRGQLNSAGGAAYVMGHLSNVVLTDAYAKDYARTVKDASIRRELAKAA